MRNEGSACSLGMVNTPVTEKKIQEMLSESVWTEDVVLNQDTELSSVLLKLHSDTWKTKKLDLPGYETSLDGAG